MAVLRCAADLSRALSDLHIQGRSFGKLSPSHVLMKESGAELDAPHGYSDGGHEDRDIRAFGALLYEMIVGQRPAADIQSSAFRLGGSNSELAGVRAAAMRLAGKCVTQKPLHLTIQKVATESRLLWVVARQFEASGAEEPPPVPAPFLVTPAVPKLKSSKTAAPGKGKSGVSKRTADAPSRSQFPELDRTAHDSGVVPYLTAEFQKAENKQAPKIAPSGGPCPKCDGAPVYVSRPRTAFERLLVRWRISLIRCHRCYHRYLAIGAIRISKAMPRETDRRFKHKRRS